MRGLCAEDKHPVPCPLTLAAFEGGVRFQSVPSNPEKSPNHFNRTFTSIILYKDYRLVWMGSWTEHMGEWMETTALLWLNNQMTHSPFIGTLMVTLRFLPQVLFAYVGGIVAHRVDRRILLMNALTAGAALSIVMAALVHFGAVESWHLLAYSIISGIINSFNHPARKPWCPTWSRKGHYLTPSHWTTRPSCLPGYWGPRWLDSSLVSPERLRSWG